MASSSVMEFNYSFQPQMDMKTDPNLEIIGNGDGDVFYAELRRQILLLTAEDDEEEADNGDSPENKRSISARGEKRGLGSGCSAALLPRSNYGWLENEEANTVPTWLVNLWRKGNGTGVFIPHIVKSRRRHKPRGRNNDRGRIYKPVTNKNSE